MPVSLETFATVREARAALAGAGTRYLGGGTLAVRASNEGDLSFDTLVRSSDPDLRRIDVSSGEARLGASVTMASIAQHRDLAAIAPAARAIGGPAIRNMATVGGNLFAPTPYGDFAVALLALGAKVDIGTEQMDIDAFLLVRDKIDAIVSGVSFRLPADGAFRFAKASRVKPKGVSVLSIAALIDSDATGTVTGARIALGCMADRPIRAKTAEDLLVGERLTEQGVAKSVAAVSDGVRPPTDPVASEWYRREVLPVHFRRLLLR